MTKFFTSPLTTLAGLLLLVAGTLVGAPPASATPATEYGVVCWFGSTFNNSTNPGVPWDCLTSYGYGAQHYEYDSDFRFPETSNWVTNDTATSIEVVSLVGGYRCNADFYRDIYEDGPIFHLGTGDEAPTYVHIVHTLQDKVMDTGQTANNVFSSVRIHCWSLA